jgi:hypothetical protein
MHEMKTLSDVLFDLAMHGADRGALVRPNQEGKATGVCVIMEGAAALAELGSKLLEIARTLGNGPADFGAPLITEEIGLKPLFEIADRAPNGWCWAAFTYGRMQITLAIFVREVEVVAKFCTEHGAPCSLDSKKAAPGWELVKPS